MKINRSFFLTLYICAAIACGLGLCSVCLTSCSTSQQRTTVNSLFTVGAGVDAAYRSYLDLVIAGKVATNSVPAISKQYAEFQTVFSAALNVASMNSNAPPSVELANAASQFNLAVKSATRK